MDKVASQGGGLIAQVDLFGPGVNLLPIQGIKSGIECYQVFWERHANNLSKTNARQRLNIPDLAMDTGYQTEKRLSDLTNLDPIFPATVI